MDPDQPVEITASADTVHVKVMQFKQMATQCVQHQNNQYRRYIDNLSASYDQLLALVEKQQLHKSWKWTELSPFHVDKILLTLEKLHTRLSEMKAEERTCKSCMDKGADAVLDGCCHVSLCTLCAMRVKDTTAQCPICRAPFTKYTTIKYS